MNEECWGVWSSLCLLFIVSPTEIAVCVGCFYLFVANNWQLGSGEEDTRRAWCTHTLFAQPPQIGDFYLSFHVVNVPHKESWWFSQVSSYNYHCVLCLKFFPMMVYIQYCD